MDRTVGPIEVPHPFTKATLLVAKCLLRAEGLAPYPPLLTPVLGNLAFPPGLEDRRFHTLLKLGTDRLCHFVAEGGLQPFERWRGQWETELGYWRGGQLFCFSQMSTRKGLPVR